MMGKCAACKKTTETMKVEKIGGTIKLCKRCWMRATFMYHKGGNRA